MNYKFNIAGVEMVIETGNIAYDEAKAVITKVHEDDEYTFDAISCAARPVEFSIANQLYSLDKEVLKNACNQANETQTIGVLSNNNLHLLLSPFVERFTFFGHDEAAKLTNDVIDICIQLNAAKLRITQFCMMRHESMPIFHQFKGIIETFIKRKDSTIKLVYFDIPEKFSYELNTLFKSYEKDLKIA